MNTPTDLTLQTAVTLLRTWLMSPESPLVDPIETTDVEGDNYWQWSATMADQLRLEIDMHEREHVALTSHRTRHFYGTVDLSQPWREGYPIPAVRDTRGRYGLTYVYVRCGAQDIHGLAEEIETALIAVPKAIRARATRLQSPEVQTTAHPGLTGHEPPQL